MPSPTLPSSPRRSVETVALGLVIAVAAFDRLIERVLRRLTDAAGPRAAAQVRRPAPHTTPRPNYRVYTSVTLEESLHRFEEHFGMQSDTFYSRYVVDELPADMPRHSANVWAGAWEEFRRLRDEEVGADDLFRQATTA